jgi:hypothetical protein
MISKRLSDSDNREEALKFALEVLKTQPALLPHATGSTIASVVTEMADTFFTYITGKAPGSTP